MGDVDLGTATGRIDIDASGAKKGVAEAGKAASDLEGKTADAGRAATTAGLALTGFGVAAIGAFAYAVNAAADFEKSLSEFKATTGSTADQMDLIREKALQLGADTKFSAKEAADAMVELGKQGLSVDQIMGGAADATTSLAAAGGIELPEAASIAAAALNQFKLQAKDLPHVADQLAGAANASATGVSELGRAMTFVGPVAQAMGFSIEDTIGALSLFANNGIDATKAGTALRAILSRLVPASKPAAASMKELGLITADGKNQFFDATGKAKSFTEVIGLLNNATKNLTAEQKINALQNIFGTEALAAANVMAGTTAKSFDELKDAIAKQSAADVAAEKMNNLSGAMEELSGSIETVVIRAGSQFQAGLTGLVKAATGFVNILGAMPPQLQAIIGYVIAGAGAFALLIGGLILGLQAVERMKEAMVALNLVLAENPVILVIAAIVALVIALVAAYKNIEAFRKVVDQLWENFQPIWDGIKNKVGEFVAWFQDTALPKIKEVFNNIVEGAKTVGKNIADFLGPKIGPVWDWLTRSAGIARDTIVSYFGPGLATIGQALQTAGSAAGDFFKNSIVPRAQEAWKAIQDGASTAKDFILNTVVPGIAPAWEQVKAGAASARDAIVDFFGPKLATVWEGLKTGAGTVVAWFQNTFGPGIQGAVQTIVDKVKEVAPQIGPAFAGAGDLLQQGFENVKGWIESDFIPFLKDMYVTKIQPAWQAFLDWIDSTFKPRLADVGKSIGEAFSGVAESINNSITSGGETDFITGLGDRIREAFNSVTSFLQETVVPGITNFVNAAIEQFGFFKEWVSVNVGPVFAALGELIAAVWAQVGPAISNALEQAKVIIGVFAVAAYAIWQLFGESILNAAMAIWGTIRGVIEGALKIITGIIQLATALITGDWGKALEGLKNITAGIFQAIFAIINGVCELLVGLAQGTAHGLVNILGAGFEAIRGKAAEVWNNIYNEIRDKVNAVRSVVQSVADFLGGVFNIDLGGAARRIMDSFINGVKGKIQEIKNLFDGITNLITEHKGPPEKDKVLLTPAGEDVMLGFKKGILSGWNDVKSLLGTMTADIAPTFGAGIGSTTNSNVTNISIEINGANGSEVRSALSDPNLIRQLTLAARAGSL